MKMCLWHLLYYVSMVFQRCLSSSLIIKDAVMFVFFVLLTLTAMQHNIDFFHSVRIVPKCEGCVCRCICGIEITLTFWLLILSSVKVSGQKESPVPYANRETNVSEWVWFTLLWTLFLLFHTVSAGCAWRVQSHEGLGHLPLCWNPRWQDKKHGLITVQQFSFILQYIK